VTIRFRFTSVATEQTSEVLAKASTRLEDWLNAAIGDADFGGGVDQFVLVAVSVDDDHEENLRFASAHDKSGRYTNPFTGERTSYVSKAVLLAPSAVIGKPPAAVLAALSASAVAALALRPSRLPKDFDYARCAKAVSMALEAYA